MAPCVWTSDALSEQVTANKRRAALLVGGSSGLVVLLAVLLAVLGNVVIALAIVAMAVALAAFLWLKSDTMILASTGAVPADQAGYARLHNLIEGLCISGGVPKPRVYVIEDAAPNAFSIGRDPRHAAIAVTTGLLQTLTRIELEGVLAHEISHIKSYDTRPATFAATVRLGGRIGLSPQRETLADVAGVALTRYPPGLIAALEKLRDDPTVVQSASRATAHLWIDAPTGRTTHPPLEERIQALREL